MNSASFLPVEFKQKYPDFTIHRGDLLISMTGTVGKEDYRNKCMVDVDDVFLLNQRVGKFELNHKQIISQFLYYYAISDDFRKGLFLNSSGGVRQANISNKGIESTRIPLPPISTHKEIASKIDNELSLILSNKQRAAIYEQKIKDRIAQVLGEYKLRAQGDGQGALEYLIKLKHIYTMYVRTM